MERIKSKNGGYVYILADSKRERLIVGSITHLLALIFDSRLRHANEPCRNLVYFKYYHNIEEAKQVENALKTTNTMECIYLIEEINPEWKDLFLLARLRF